MAWLNYHLHSNQTLEKDKVIEVGLMFNKKFPTNWTNSQLKVLDNVLCNLVKYQQENKIFYYQRSMPNLLQRYNPLGLGHQQLKNKKSGVLWKLKKAQLVDITVGDNPYLIPAQWYEEGYQTETSTFRAKGQGTLEFAKLLGITRETIQRAEGTHHVIFKVWKGNELLDYKDNKFTKHVESTMKEYCNFLNKYEIKIGKVQFEDIMLRRTFRNSDGSFRFLFGGRSGRYWMEYPKAKRRKMTINGKPVAQEPLDFTSSQLNILYAWKLGKKLEHKDRYEIEGYEGTTYRKLIKLLTVIMLNTRNSQHANGAFVNAVERDYPYLAEKMSNSKDFFNPYKVMKLIRNTNKEIADCFYNPLIGRNLEFIESGLIFEIALQCCRQGIPALTVHDELIVLAEDRDIAEMIMNSTYIDRKLYRFIH